MRFRDYLSTRLFLRILRWMRRTGHAEREIDHRSVILLRSLVGHSLTSVEVVEMAISGHEEEPIFSNTDLHFIQADYVDLSIEDGRRVRVRTCQDDDIWSLLAELSDGKPPPWVSGPDVTIFRCRALEEFPLGLIQSVDCMWHARNHVQQATLCIEGANVHLKTGEIYEDFDGRLTVANSDERVLVFLSNDALQKNYIQ